MITNKWKYYFGEAINNITKTHKVMSLISIFTIALAMFVFNFLFVGLLNLNHISNNMASQITISAYFDSNLSRSNAIQISDNIKGISNVASVEFNEREKSFNNLKDKLNNSEEGLGEAINNIENPLPDSVTISVVDATKIDIVAKEVNELDGIESVSYGKSLVHRILDFTQFIHLMYSSFLVVIVIATAFIIANTTRMSIHARKDEIDIMKYLGAKDSMVMFPFLFEGMILGVLGGFVSSIVFRIFYSIFVAKVSELIPFIELIPSFPFLTYIILITIMVSAFVGIVGSFLSTKKYLSYN